MTLGVRKISELPIASSVLPEAWAVVLQQGQAVRATLADVGAVAASPVVTLDSFFQVGDSNYAAALQRFMDSSTVFVCTGLGKTYDIGAGGVLGKSNKTLVDMNLNATLGTNGVALDFQGTQGSTQTFLADVPAASFTISVPDGTAFTADSWAFLASNEQWAPTSGDNVKFGELVYVVAVSGNLLTLAGATLLPYTTAQSATIRPMNMLSNVKLSRVQVNGNLTTVNTIGFRFRYCSDVLVEQCTTVEIDYTHVYVDRSARVTVRGHSARKTGVQEGLDYGVAVLFGSYDVEVLGLRCDSMRHIVTVGGSQGICRWLRVLHCFGTNLTDAGLDSHSAIHEHLYAFNQLHFSDDVDTTIDGITIQGSAPVIIGNTVSNCKRHGISWQPETLQAAGVVPSAIIANNKLSRSRTDLPITTNAVNVSSGTLAATPYAEVVGLVLDNNQVDGTWTNAVHITASTNNPNKMRQVRISGHQAQAPLASRGVFINAIGADIDGVVVEGCSVSVVDAAINPVIDLVGVGSNFVRRVRAYGNRVARGAGGALGIRLILCDDVQAALNSFENIAAGSKFSVDSLSLNVRLDQDKSGQAVTVTNNTYTVNANDDNLVCNRAGTITLTLPSAAIFPNRRIWLKTIQAQTVVSASSNVQPIDDTTPGTAILPATDGAWAMLRSNGTDWVITARG